MSEDIYRLIEAYGERLTDLAKAYRVLNESHSDLELSVVKLETKVDTAVAIVKWILSPMAVISLIIKLVELAGWL